MINIKIHVFTKDKVTGLHLECEPLNGKPEREKLLAVHIIQTLKQSLSQRAQHMKTDGATMIETHADSAVNLKLRKEFGLDEDSNDKQA